MTEPKAVKPPRSKGSKGSAPPIEAEPAPPTKADPAPPTEAEPGPAAEPPRSEQDRLREVNEQLRIERELAGKRREQDLRRRR